MHVATIPAVGTRVAVQILHVATVPAIQAALSGRTLHETTDPAGDARSAGRNVRLLHGRPTPDQSSTGPFRPTERQSSETAIAANETIATIGVTSSAVMSPSRNAWDFE